MNKNITKSLLGLALSGWIALSATAAHGSVKKLNNSMVSTIDAIFTANPDFAAGIIIKLDISCMAGKRVLHDLPNMQDAQVPERLARVLGPVLEYLGDLKQQKNFIEPLIKESFGDNRYATSIMSEMLATTMSLESFFAGRIKTKTDLATICHELVDFFQDLKNSLSGSYLALAEQKKLALKKATAMAKASHGVTKS
jgi:hypothetical protein